MSLRIGDILIRAGLISSDQLELGLRLQQRRGGRLGTIIAGMDFCSQEKIDTAWADAVVVPALEDAINRACANRFMMHKDRRVTFNRIIRRDTMIEDMLNGCSIDSARVQIEGQAVMYIGSAQCLPIDFSIDQEHGFALLDDNSESIVRRWVGIVERRRQHAASQQQQQLPTQADQPPAA